MDIKPALSFITLGVKNLEKMKNFYIRKFGWTPIKDSDGIVMFQLNGCVLSLFPVDELAEDAGVKNNGKGFKCFTLAICLHSEKDVNKFFESMRKKAVVIVKEPTKVFWGGYSGYIEDIEHNLWEIAFNPFIQLDESGNIVSIA